MLHCTPVASVPSIPVAFVSGIRSPREAVCAVAYSQLSPDPPTASSLHCWSGAALGSIAQNDATVLPPVSISPVSWLAGAARSSASVHACAPEKLVLQASFAPGSPSVALKLKRPGVAGNAPTTPVPPDPGSVVVVVAVVDCPQLGGVG